MGKGTNKKLKRQTTRKPLTPESLKEIQETKGVNMEHHQVNYGNVVELAMKMISNINANISNIARDVEELKNRK